MSTIAPAQETELLAIVADHYNRYPGELVTLHLRFRVPEEPGAQLQLSMPRVMQAEIYDFPPEIPTSLVSVAEHGPDVIVLLPLGDPFRPGMEYNIKISARLQTFYANQYLLVDASLVIPEQAATLAASSLRLTVFGKGKYLQYLPELYESDDFTSRFLMLFESFWKPVNQQIDLVENYFDPRLTPPEFVPWLASWVGLAMDEGIPLKRMRKLVGQAMPLFQRRGTKQALKTYLEIYTGGEVEVIERRAANFVLGPKARLGTEIALGKQNRPNTVMISLKLPEAELQRSGYTRQMYQRKIFELVRAIIPAHVSYEIECNFI